MTNRKELEAAFGDCWHTKAAEIFDLLSAGVSPETVAGTAHTLTQDNAGSYLVCTNAGAVTITVPTNAAVRYRPGTVITIEQAGAGQVTVAAAGGVTINSAGGLLATSAQYAVIALVKRDTNVWTLMGDQGLILPAVIAGGGGAAAYHADAVHFEIANNIARFSALTGVSDARTGLLSMWWNSAAPTTGSLWTEQDNGAIRLSTNNQLGLRLELTNEGNLDFIIGKFNIDIYDGAWHHILWSWNTNFAAPDRVIQLYVDDVAAVLDTSSQDGVAFDCWYTDTGGWEFGASASEEYNTSDFLFYPGGTFVDLTVEANRRKFIDASGKPVNPTEAIAAFGTAPVLFSGDASGWPINQGTGGAFEIIGNVPTNASTSPSD